MKQSEVKVGRYYAAKISGQLTVVKIEAKSSYGGWSGRNVMTNRRVRIKTAAKLREDVTDKVESKRHKIRYLHL